MKQILGILLILIVIVLGIWYVSSHTGAPAATSITATSTPASPIAVATYACDAGKSIKASYFQGTSTPIVAPGQPPVPTGSVALTLSDGRSMTLTQTLSADGARYANAAESIVFWNKGRGVMFNENNQQTYTGCIEVAQDPGGLPQAYVNATKGFSLRYPANYKVEDKYSYTNLGPGKSISGVKFTIDPAIAAGTNLSNDSYLSVEMLPNVSADQCTANHFLDLSNGGKLTTITDGSTTYSVASSTGAGAGNRYAETVYAISGSNPCTAVRYFIHYGVIGNYPAGNVKEFDQAALTAQFDAIRRTLTLQ